MKKIVLITGGAGGIGQACIKRFITDSSVIILDVNSAAVEKCKEQYGIDGYVVDLENISSIKNVISEIVNKYERIDVLVQTAGLMEGKPALDVEPFEFSRMMKINVESLFFVMSEVVKQSMKELGGTILNFSSAAAIRGFAGPMASVHYSTSKGAVIAMSRQLAVEWGEYKVRVNSICPGGVMTPAMEKLEFHEDLSVIPARKLSTPAEIADVVYFLCSDQSNMINGQNIVVDGGRAAVGG